MPHSVDTDADARWLTLAELARDRGISQASAARLVRRKKWRRQPDNEGGVRILVPTSPGANADIRVADRRNESDAVRALQTAIEALTVQLQVANTRAEKAEAKVEELRQAEAQRAGKGRWARLRAAWRRE